MNIEQAVTIMTTSREIKFTNTGHQTILSAAELLYMVQSNEIKFNHYDLAFDQSIRNTTLENLYGGTEFNKVMVGTENDIILSHNQVVADLLNIASLPVDDETGYVEKAKNTVLLLEYID